MSALSFYAIWCLLQSCLALARIPWSRLVLVWCGPRTGNWKTIPLEHVGLDLSVCPNIRVRPPAGPAEKENLCAFPEGGIRCAREGNPEFRTASTSTSVLRPRTESFLFQPADGPGASGRAHAVPIGKRGSLPRFHAAQRAGTADADSAESRRLNAFRSARNQKTVHFAPQNPAQNCNYPFTERMNCAILHECATRIS